MSNKKLCAKRLVIFLLLAFGLAWIPWIILNKLIGYHEWFETSHYALFSIPTLYAPAIANLLTRLITKEGFSDLKLHLRLKGHLKYYLAAALLIPLLGILSAALVTGFFGADSVQIQTKLDGAGKLAAVLSLLMTAPLAAFNTFGEEFGWRAYMNQKMEPLLGTTGTVLAGGILWGVWHAPLTAAGHNFGLDYAGYPYTGILAMAVICTVNGAILMWLTKRTDSVYPAAIYHACNNNGSQLIGLILLLNGIPEITAAPPDPVRDTVTMLPFILTAGIVLILMLRDAKQKKTAPIAAENQATV